MGPSDGHPSLVSFVEHWTHRALIYLPVTKYCALCSTRWSACESPLWPAAFYKFSSKTKGLCHWWISISVSAPAAICFWVGGQCYFFQIIKWSLVGQDTGWDLLRRGSWRSLKSRGSGAFGSLGFLRLGRLYHAGHITSTTVYYTTRPRYLGFVRY